MIENRVQKNLLDYQMVQKNEYILIGVSGGGDSIALLHILLGLKEKLSLKIVVVHVNHLLRGRESDLDEAFVRDFCRGNNIPVIIKRIDVHKIAKEKKFSIEEAAREVRYQTFHEVGNTFGAYKIATAHHMDDQGETILMHIMRGTGIEGLMGMDFVSGKLIRPLLNISKREIVDYINQQDLKPRLDESNYEPVFTRNKIRLDLIPYIWNQFGVDIRNNLIKLSDTVKGEDEFVEKFTLKTFEELLISRLFHEIVISYEPFSKIHKAIKRRLIRKIILDLKGNLKGIHKINIDKAIEFIEIGRVGTLISLPSCISLYKHYQEIRFMIEKERSVFLNQNAYFEESFTNKNSISVDSLLIKKEIISIECLKVNLEDEKSRQYVQLFDFDKIESKGFELMLRSRRTGDRIKLFEKGRQKLKDYFINHKIDSYKRNSIPLSAIGNEILWIIGYAVTINYGIDETTKTVLRVELLKK